MRRTEFFIQQFIEIAKTAETQANIEAFLSIAPKAPLYVLVRQQIVYAPKLELDRLKGKFENRGWLLDTLNENVGSYWLERKPEKNKSKSAGLMVFLKSAHPDFYRLTTISRAAFWERTVKWFLKNSFPTLTPVVFRQQEIKEALLNLENELGPDFQLLISDITLKEKHARHERSLDTERWWTRMSLGEVFFQAEERGQWFQGLRFNVAKKASAKSKQYVDVSYGRLSKDGQIRFDWMYDQISKGLVSILEEFASQRMTLLDNRGLKERDYEPSGPIVVNYNSNVFSGVEQIRDFGRILSKYPQSSLAVLHGNPYYHASVADYLDGSSFEVWIVSASRILLVPQSQSTEQAFIRLIGYIFTEFREGVISEYGE